MNIYLFLYPVREYVEKGGIGLSLQRFQENGHSIRRLSDIIAARYRAKRYKICWLLFSESSNKPFRPDYLGLASQINVHYMEDSFLTCGITFADHVQHKRYPETDFILDQLPEPVSRLVLGGFHQGDCVDKLAAAAHKRNIPVVVDEDTTDYFFYRTNFRGEIPLDRALDEHVRELFEDQGHKLTKELLIANRTGRPWLMMPPR